jgi:hypothetical protein
MPGMWMALALAALEAGPGLAFRGDETCPSPGEVERAFAEIDRRPAGEPAGREPVVVEIAASPPGALLRFFGGDGGLVGERRLPPELPCDDRARAAAVIIAARLTRLPGEPVKPPRLPALEATVAASVPRPWGPELEVAAQGALAGSSAAGGAQIGAALAGGAGVLRMGLLYLTPHHVRVGAGEAAWSRLALALGYGRRAGWGASTGEVSVNGVLSALRIEGRDFRQNERHIAVHPGAAIAARLGRRVGPRLQLWAGVTLAGWLRRQELFVRDGAGQAAVPRLEALGALGVTWALE